MGAPELKAAIFHALDDGARHVVLEMSEVTFVDSAVLAVFVGTHKRVRADGGTIKVVAPSESVRGILEVTGMDAVIDVVEQ